MSTTRQIGSKIEEWINSETGEVRQVQEVDIKASDKGFDKIWLGLMLSVLDIIGGKKIEVMKYILDKRNRTDNTILATQEKIAEETKISKKTVNTTIAELKTAGLLIQIIPGLYRINPAMIWRGSHLGRMAIMAKFSEEKASETPKEVKEVSGYQETKKELQKAS